MAMESNLTVRGVSPADKWAASGKNKSVAFSLSNLPAEVERELRIRERTYARWILQGKI